MSRRVYNDRRRQQAVFAYLDTPEETRPTVSVFLKENHMRRPTFNYLAGLYEGQALGLEEAKKHADKEANKEKKREYSDRLGVALEGEYDSETWLKHRTIEADQALLRGIKKNDVKSIRLFYELLGRLKDQKEVTYKLDGSWITATILAGLREMGEGMVAVQIRPLPLPDGVLLSSGQGANEDR